MSRAIERVSLAHLRIPFKEPFPTTTGDLHVKDAILVVVESGDGLVGLGECSPPLRADGLADSVLSRCWDDLASRIVPDLLGRQFAEIDEIASACTAWNGCHASAVAGAETACWDLLGQQTHESLAELLGASEIRIELGVESGLWMGNSSTIVDLLRAIEPHLAEGYKRLKIRIAPGRDVEFVKAIRAHYPDLPLQVDARGSYGRDDAEVFRRLDEFLMLMIENPFPAEDLEGMVELQKSLITPICLEATSVEAMRRGACRIVKLEIQRAGGLGPALKLTHEAQENGVSCWVSTTPELGVGQAQAIHLATLSNCKYPAEVAPSTRWFVDDVVVPPIEHDAPGIFSVPTRPGLGHLVDPVKVRRYQIRQQEWTARPGA